MNLVSLKNQEPEKEKEPILIDRYDTHLKTDLRAKQMVIKLLQMELPELGMVEIATTQYGGHPPEFWAKQLTEKIVGVSDDNEEHV